MKLFLYLDRKIMIFRGVAPIRDQDKLRPVSASRRVGKVGNFLSLFYFFFGV
jgi:hypothetical protein